MDYKELILKNIDSRKDYYNDIALKIHEHPETAYNEVYASALFAEELRKNGFKVETGLYGMPRP